MIERRYRDAIALGGKVMHAPVRHTTGSEQCARARATTAEPHSQPPDIDCLRYDEEE